MLRRKHRKCATFCSFSFCRKALTALQRGACCITTGPPLSCKKAAFATPRGPPWSAADEKWYGDGGRMSKFRLCRSPELKFSSVKFRDIIVTRRGVFSNANSAQRHVHTAITSCSYCHTTTFSALQQGQIFRYEGLETRSNGGMNKSLRLSCFIIMRKC